MSAAAKRTVAPDRKSSLHPVWKWPHCAAAKTGEFQSSVIYCQLSNISMIKTYNYQTCLLLMFCGFWNYQRPSDWSPWTAVSNVGNWLSDATTQSMTAPSWKQFTTSKWRKEKTPRQQMRSTQRLPLKERTKFHCFERDTGARASANSFSSADNNCSQLDFLHCIPASSRQNKTALFL